MDFEEAVAGEVFAAGLAERGNDFPLFFSTTTAEKVDGSAFASPATKFREPRSGVDAPRSAWRLQGRRGGRDAGSVLRCSVL